MYEPLIPPVKGLLITLAKPFKPVIPFLETPQKVVIAGVVLTGIIILIVRLIAIIA